MQPNEKLTPEERMAELEEASILLAGKAHGWQMYHEEDRPAAQGRLAYLMQRMQDRHLARAVAQKRRERDTEFQANREKYRQAHKEGRLMEYHCSESGEHAMFIKGDKDVAHIDWLNKHPDAVLLLNTGPEGYKFKQPVRVTAVKSHGFTQEEDGWRCDACGYFMRGDVSFENPPLVCENCSEHASAVTVTEESEL